MKTQHEKECAMPIASHQASPALGLPYIMPAQALSYITHNEALRALDVYVQTRILSRSRLEPPTDPNDGDTYIVPDPQGDWPAPPSTVLRYQEGGYQPYTPYAGWSVWLHDENQYLHYDGTAWQALERDGADLSALTQLGINATADETNRLAIASDAVLLNHAGSSHRCVVNKSSAEDTASFIFQSGFQGFAEFGLLGSQDFALKTSENGSDFQEVFHVDAATANLRLPDSRRLEFDIESGNKQGVSYIRIRQGNMSFEKPTSDDALAAGTAFVFVGCGCKSTGNPFWQGLHLTSTVVSHNGSNILPRTSLFWQFSNQEDPDDLSFVMRATASGLDADIVLEPAGQGVIIADTSKGLRVGPDTQPVKAMLDVQGTLKLKLYTIATLPNGQDVGTLAMVTDSAQGVELVFFDGEDWRTISGRHIL